jgi:hypothetical protein
LFLFNKSLKDLLFFIEKIIYTSSNSSHKSLKKNKSSSILNSKTSKLKETRLLDVVRKISKQKVYSDQLNTSNEYSCLENEEDGDDDIILVEPNEIEKEVDILYHKWNQAEIIFDKYKTQVTEVLLGIEYRIDVFSQLLPLSRSLQKLIKFIILLFITFCIGLPLLSGMFKLSFNDFGVVIVAFIGIFLINIFKTSILR